MDEQINEEAAKDAAKRIVTMKGRPMTLAGDEIKPGTPAPDFKVIDNNLTPMKFLRTYNGKVVVISSVPSLDTAVCDLQTRRFNKEAESLDPDISVITISMDLPFAQKRWCGTAGVTRVQTFSDHQKGDFGKAWGVLIKDLRLLARAVFIVDKEGLVRYAQLVPEVGQEPDYDEALAALKNIAG
ncbi:MAG: thiol peroxidase atypical 2-Cys peroxiredoxin [Elusimicrobia bacterium]|nr:MAG: thiol peroxidase atypical 2-Cys peroxiredoxin [Elusimicrobiota bacterium]KAF0157135.1 MAG: thiol peroxidase atypical 2-Cys peroxiredoxin [Elusimicrobiota bacterium]